MQNSHDNDNNTEDRDSEEEEEIARAMRASRDSHSIEEGVRSAANSSRNTRYGVFGSLAPRLPTSSMVRAPEGSSLSSSRASGSSMPESSGVSSRRNSSDTASASRSGASSRTGIATGGA